MGKVCKKGEHKWITKNGVVVCDNCGMKKSALKDTSKFIDFYSDDDNENRKKAADEWPDFQ